MIAINLIAVTQEIIFCDALYGGLLLYSHSDATLRRWLFKICHLSKTQNKNFGMKDF